MRMLSWRGVRTGAMAGLALMWAWAADAQAPRLQNVHLWPQAFPKLSVEFDVVDQAGEFRGPLQPTGVQVVEGDRAVQGTLTARASPDGTSYLIVLDNSPSVRRALPDATTSLKGFVDRLEARDRVGLVTFSSEAKIVSNITQDRAAVLSQLAAVKVSGTATELFYSVVQGLGLFEQPGLPSRKVAIVVSDGRDEGKAYTLEDCIARARKLGVNVIAVSTPDAPPAAKLVLRRLAESTEGIFLTLAAKGDLESGLGMIRRYVDSRSLFTWSTTVPQDGASHTVRLEVAYNDVRVTRALSFDAPAPPPPPPPPPPPVPWWKTSVGIWGLAGAAILLALGAGLLVWWRRKRGAERAAAAKAEQERAEEARQDLDRRIHEVAGRVEDLRATGREPRAPAPASDVKRHTVFQPAAAAGARSYARGRVEVVQGALAGSSFSIAGRSIALGRDDDNGVVLDDEKVSRHHAQIYVDGGVFYVRDLGSANGTFVDGGRRVGDAQPLVDGQTISMGSVVLRFRGEG